VDGRDEPGHDGKEHGASGDAGRRLRRPARGCAVSTLPEVYRIAFSVAAASLVSLHSDSRVEGAFMRAVFLSGVAVVALSLAGCATVTRGTTNQVQFVSEPSGAEVRTSLQQSCTTPCTLSFSRKDEFNVTFSRPGYQSETVFVRTQVAGAGAAGFAGNLVVGGVVGMGVDAATGSTLEHVPNPVSVTLRPAGGGSRGRGPRGAPISSRADEPQS
jgi:hypothetical protein